MKETFLVITGDVVSSREISNRERLQKKLASLCEEVNKKFKEFIVVKFSITIGDEIQGLIRKNSPLLQITGYFEENLYPYKMRFGAGEGSISTNFYNTTSQMDGECFFNSRQAIINAEKEKRSIKII